MGSSYDSLSNEAKIAVDWKAKRNLNMALAGGSEMAIANQKKFLLTNKESLANNPESVRLIVMEFKSLTLKEDD